jgi:hypothetical protein
MRRASRKFGYDAEDSEFARREGFVLKHMIRRLDSQLVADMKRLKTINDVVGDAISASAAVLATLVGSAYEDDVDGSSDVSTFLKAAKEDTRHIVERAVRKNIAAESSDFEAALRRAATEYLGSNIPIRPQSSKNPTSPKPGSLDHMMRHYGQKMSDVCTKLLLEYSNRKEAERLLMSITDACFDRKLSSSLLRLGKAVLALFAVSAAVSGAMYAVRPDVAESVHSKATQGVNRLLALSRDNFGVAFDKALKMTDPYVKGARRMLWTTTRDAANSVLRRVPQDVSRNE